MNGISSLGVPYLISWCWMCFGMVFWLRGSLNALFFIIIIVFLFVHSSEYQPSPILFFLRVLVRFFIVCIGYVSL